MGDTEISWTHRPGTRGRTWNPTQGCSLVSEGCRNCYAMRMAARFAESGWSQGLINLRTGKWNGTVRVADHKLADPIRWRDPSTVFVNSMSDLFHDGFTNEQIAAVFGVMAAAPQHTFQILTKRPERMRAWFAWAEEQGDLSVCLREAYCYLAGGNSGTEVAERLTAHADAPWPLPNVWLGTSVENQEAADERIPELLRTPAVVRFLSCEPLLGPVDLTGRLDYCERLDKHGISRRVGGEHIKCDAHCGISWVIAGCESGPGARDCSTDWLRSLRDQCASAGVPYFLKQAVVPVEMCKEGCRQPVRYTVMNPTDAVAWCGCTVEGPESCSPRGVLPGEGSKRKGHGFGGPVYEAPCLDGVPHQAFPPAKVCPPE